jgi:ribonucleoside-diphosphate reductase alpha chain
METTNPCGELPLRPNETCNLGSINLPRFVKEEHGRKSVDWDRLKEVTQIAVRFLDDLITANDYPTEAIANVTLANRKIGLGLMGFAELCILLDIPYAGNEAAMIAEDLMGFVMAESRRASGGLAEDRGVFPN